MNKVLKPVHNASSFKKQRIKSNSRLSITQSFVLYGQVTKCTRRMPWQLEAMKDVGACDKARGAGKQALILAFLNGETHPSGYLALNT